jgi:hypothetical protein
MILMSYQVRACLYFLWEIKDGYIILEEQSLLRNKILAKTYTIGAPSERQIPSELLVEGKYPLIFQYPIPSELESNSRVTLEPDE